MGENWRRTGTVLAAVKLEDGQVVVQRLPEAGEDLELKMGENWRRTGTVLAAVKLEDGQVVVQVVMNNYIEPYSIFRVRDDANTLHIEPLQYSLED